MILKERKFAFFAGEGFGLAEFIEGGKTWHLIPLWLLPLHRQLFSALPIAQRIEDGIYDQNWVGDDRMVRRCMAVLFSVTDHSSE